MEPLSSSRSDSSLGGSASVQNELQSLRLTLQITVVALVILAGSIGIFIFRQVSLLRRQAEATGRQAQQLVQFYNTSVATQAVHFEKRIQDFALSNPDFRARIGKYFGQPEGTNTASPLPPAGAPATPRP